MSPFFSTSRPHEIIASLLGGSASTKWPFGACLLVTSPVRQLTQVRDTRQRAFLLGSTMAIKIVKTHDGAMFGAWTVRSAIDRAYVMCICQCGTERVIHRSNLTSGKTKSCGCLKPQHVSAKTTKHGMYGTPTYSSWSSMMTRCYSQTCKAYPRYGGRGILVAEAWHKFDGFFADMGAKPAKGWSIERLDNSRGYEPGNCVWATAKEQGRNTRRTKLNLEVVAAIRSGAMSTTDVMAATGCAASTVSSARNGVNWKED